MTEGEAAQRSARHYGVSPETIRRWARLYRAGGPAALLPKPPGPQTGTGTVSLRTQLLIVALRRLLGWNEKRIAAELARRGLAQVSHTTVGRIEVASQPGRGTTFTISLPAAPDEIS